jgi:hypothetical protein
LGFGGYVVEELAAVDFGDLFPWTAFLGMNSVGSLPNSLQEDFLEEISRQESLE